jgi:hypothetical protein
MACKPHIDAAAEVLAFVESTILLAPASQQAGSYPSECRVSNVDRAFQIYGAPLNDASLAESLRLGYLPDRVSEAQGELMEYGSGNQELFDMAIRLKGQIQERVFVRIGHLSGELANEMTGLLCAILEARLARGSTMPFFEQLFDALKYGFWPCGLRLTGKREDLIVYVGGLPGQRGV